MHTTATPRSISLVRLLVTLQLVAGCGTLVFVSLWGVLGISMTAQNGGNVPRAGLLVAGVAAPLLFLILALGSSLGGLAPGARSVWVRLAVTESLVVATTLAILLLADALPGPRHIEDFFSLPALVGLAGVVVLGLLAGPAARQWTSER